MPVIPQLGPSLDHPISGGGVAAATSGQGYRRTSRRAVRPNQPSNTEIVTTERNVMWQRSRELDPGVCGPRAPTKSLANYPRCSAHPLVLVCSHPDRNANIPTKPSHYVSCRTGSPKVCARGMHFWLPGEKEKCVNPVTRPSRSLPEYANFRPTLLWSRQERT